MLGLKYEDVANFGTNYDAGFVRPFSNSIDKVIAFRSVKDCYADASRVFSDVFIDDNDEMNLLQSSPLTKYSMFDISSCGEKSIGITFPDKEKKIFIDVTVKQKSEYRVEVSKIHGSVMCDTSFGGCSWSHDGKYFVYAAQPLASKTSFVSNASDKFEYKEDWGEKFTNISDCVLCILDVETGVCSVIPDVNHVKGCPGQPVFVSCDAVDMTSGSTPKCVAKYHVIYTYWFTSPRRIGLFTCYHRKSCLMQVDVTPMLNNEAVALSHVNITPNLNIARSCRFNYSASNMKLVFLGYRDELMVHNAAWQLYAIDVCTDNNSSCNVDFKGIRLVVDSIDKPSPTSQETGGEMQHNFDFPGVYVDQLPRRCFISDTLICTHTMWGSQCAMVVIDVSEDNSNEGCGASNAYAGRVLELDAVATRIKRFNRDLSITGGTPCDFSTLVFTVLEVMPHERKEIKAASILFTVSSPTVPQRLCRCKFELEKLEVVGLSIDTSPLAIFNNIRDHGDGSSVLSRSKSIFNQISSVKWKVFCYWDENRIPYESVVFYPTMLTSAIPLPVVMVPHGGPHSVFVTSFAVMHPYVYLAQALSSCIVIVNYRGSIGYGQGSIESLPGNIGCNDMHDVLTVINGLKLQSASDALKGGNLPPLDWERVGILGGSHGGFLAAHAVGQYPDTFKVAVLRNPVTNIPAMYTIADIPDWCMVEACGINYVHTVEKEGGERESCSSNGTAVLQYDFDLFKTASKADLVQMYEKSPIKYMSSVVAPTLLLLGAKDRRVPMAQGIEYHHALKSKNIPTKCLIFPEDTHAIDKPLSASVCWDAAKDWFISHL